MRSMPQLQEGAKTTLMTSAFYGYNHNKIISDGEMYDMQNLSGDDYPLLSLRHKRGISSWDAEGQTPVPLTGIHGRDQLVFVRGMTVYYNMIPVNGISVSTDPEMCPKKIVSFGAYVCIWPDKVYFNTADQSDCGSMESSWTGNGEDISLIMCRGDGTNYDMAQIATGAQPPENPENGKLWIDQSGDAAVLRQYSSYTDEWTEVPTTYVKIQGTGIGANVKEYDSISISGLAAVDGSTQKILQQVEALNGSKIVYFRGNDYLVVAGLLTQTQNALADAEVHADMTLPDLDYVVESNNRLWGCRYGLVDGQTVNEIYASKLGDFRNWRSYMGISTDSWTASVGTDGAFTGAITQRGYPVFFKENCIHRVSGNTPGSFSIQTTIARGVQRGSWRSLAVVGENIYYKARDGVMIYDGNMPVKVSEQLGDILYADARAGVLKDQYYISMKDADNHWTLFKYDTAHQTWWKEDSVQALGFGAAEDELYFIDEVHNTLVSVRGTFGEPEADFDWAAEFDLYGVKHGNYDDPKRTRNSKYVSLFKIRMDLDRKAFMRLWLKYNEDRYEFKGEKRGEQLRTFVLPVIPKRCDHVRFKLTGHGGATIYSISRILEVGGDG